MRARRVVPTARRLAVAVVAAALVAGCGSDGSEGSRSASEGQTGDPATDKLAQVLARGTLVMFTDPEYPPQSMSVKGASRSADTACAANQLSAPEVTGYDAETGKAVAAALGVEPCFVTPSWDEVISGSWNDRWDIAWGSGAITADRMERLYVTQPSYSTPTNLFVAADAPFQEAADLSHKSVGACAGCTMEQYLRGTLELPGVTLSFPIVDPDVQPFDNEIPGLRAVAHHKLDGFVCSEPVGKDEIDRGLSLRMVPGALYETYKTGYVDRSSGLSSKAFVEKVDKIIQQLHGDGTLTRLSEKFFGTDYATAASAFDLSALDQQVQ